MDGYGGGIAVWCHIVGARNFVKLLTCVDVAFRESQVSHGFEEYSVIHAPEGAFEIGVGRVYVFFFFLVSTYIMICVERLSYIFLCRLNLAAVSLRISCASAQGEPIFF